MCSFPTLIILANRAIQGISEAILEPPPKFCFHKLVKRLETLGSLINMWKVLDRWYKKSSCWIHFPDHSIGFYNYLTPCIKELSRKWNCILCSEFLPVDKENDMHFCAWHPQRNFQHNIQLVHGCQSNYFLYLYVMGYICLLAFLHEVFKPEFLLSKCMHALHTSSHWLMIILLFLLMMMITASAILLYVHGSIPS